MAERPFLVDINLNGNQIKNVIVETLTSDPPTDGNEGRIYYNTVDRVFKYCNGSQWISGQRIEDSQIPTAEMISLIEETTASYIKFRVLGSDKYIKLNTSGGIIKIKLDTDEVAKTLGIEGIIQSIEKETTRAKEAEEKLADDLTKVKGEVEGSISEDIAKLEEKIANQTFALGFDDESGDVYALVDVDNTSYAGATINEETGEVVVKFNVES